MAHSVNHVLGQLQRWTAERDADVCDAVLLERYVHQRDEAAFAALVARHGALVLRVCQRILGDNQRAEDAFQAAFVVLARKASSLRQPEALAGWLHGVARRVALKARSKVALRGAERSATTDELPDPHPDPLAQLTARELLMVVDEEVQRLSAAQRSAVVLCCLEGQTREEAARQLGWTLAALKSHLQRGRQRLQKRLARRGIALPAALAAVVLSRSEAVSALLLRSTVAAALSGGIGSSAAALAHSVLKTMFLTKLAAVTSVVLTVALAASATVAVVYRGSSAEDPPYNPPVAAARQEPIADKPQPRTDALGDPLPDGAIARLGTVRLRHGGLITFAAFTPDGKRLVSRGDDGVRVWDAATGKQLRYFAPEKGNKWGAADLSSDGKTLAASLESRDGHIDFWDISSGKKMASFGQGYYALVRLSPDGKWLAAYESADGPTRAAELWDVASKRRLRSWKPHGVQQVFQLVFSADSRRLLTSGGEGKVRLWDIESGQQLQEFTRLDRSRDHFFLYPAEALSPDEKLLALLESSEKGNSQAGAVQWKARLSLHDATTGKRVRLLTCPSQEVYPGQAPTFSAVTFTPDGKKLVTGGPDRFLRIWDSATGDELQRWPLELGRPWSLTPSRDGKWLAAVMYQGSTIQILDMANGKPRQSPVGHLAGAGWAVLTPAGRTAITNGSDSKLLLWDVTAGRVLHTLKGHEDGSLAGMQMAPDGRTLYTVGWDKTVRVWDLNKGEELRRFSLDREFISSAFGTLALSPDGKILAVLSATKTIQLFDATSGRELRRFEGPQEILESAFAADGHSLVVCSGDLVVRIWDTRNGRLLRDYPLPPELRIGQPFRVGGPPSTHYGAAVSPDGRLLAVANGFVTLPNPKYFLVLKDLATGQEVHRLDHLPGEVYPLTFSPDGRILAWSSRKDHSIHLVETSSGSERRRLPGHAGAPVSHLAFSADGSRLISSSRNTTALVWDVRDAAEQHPATAAELQALWTDLAAEDAARAYQAIRKLAASPTSAIPFMKKQLAPVPAVDEKRLTRLLADLDSDDFAARQSAAEELAKIGEPAVPAIREALAAKPSLESRRRLDDLLDKAQRLWWDKSGGRLRSLRAIEALELSGTKEAREVLKTLADGAAGARLTEEARAALQRLRVAQH